jgi:hypothetical protein
MGVNKLTAQIPVEKLAMEWQRTTDFVVLKCPHNCGKTFHGASEGEALASLAGHVNMVHSKKVFPK